MTNAPFILVCHPGSLPGFATPCQNEQDLVDRWVNGLFDARCNCCASESLVATYDAAIEDIGHDMHHLTRLNSRAEYDEYMAGTCHNKSPDSVYRAALLLDWVDIAEGNPSRSEDDSCMTPNEADELLRIWNSQKPTLFVLLMREDNQWSETAYGETCVSSDEDDMQATVNDLCKNCRDFRGAKFGYSDYPFDSSNIVERLFDENTYDEE